MLGFIGGLGGGEILVLLVLGILLFGRKLPDIGRYVGQTVVEFKKGITGIEDRMDGSISRQELAPEPVKPPQRISATAPKFDDDDTPKA